MKQKQKFTRRRKALWILLTMLAILFTAAIIAVAAWLAPYTKVRMDMTLLHAAENDTPSVLLSYTPENRAARSGDTHESTSQISAKSTSVPCTPPSEMPPELLRAFVAVEDKRFHTHKGVDPIRTTRAVLGYLTGNPTCGGSTITQQLVKNLTGRSEQTPERKLTEIFTALDLERRADKETVLGAYLHIINLGQGCFGVDAAAETYFRKSVKELTLPECATLAAITNNPTRYDPLTHPEESRARRDLVLTLMAEQGYITEEERDDAIAAPLGLSPAPKAERPPATSWYADLVISDVIRDLMLQKDYTYAAASRLLYSGGLRVETVMDETLQVLVEAYYADLSHFPAGEKGRPQSSFILIDPETGDILAVAGAIGEKSASRIQSYATDTRRPAGSCIKPLSVFAPALERGLITWGTVLSDEPLTQRKGVPWPSNADGLYRGRVTVGESVAHSLNPAAVEILTRVGVEESFRFTREKLGLAGLIPPEENTAHDCTVSSLALGQQSRGVTSLELTAAYTVLYGGIRKEAVSYARVLDREGNILLENNPTHTEVLSPETSAILTRLLMKVNREGTAARYLKSTPAMGMETAGKTGTTQGNCDRRYIGMTPRLLAGVWMGYDYPTELKGIRGNPCVTVWDELMALCESRYEGAPPKLAFDLPHTLTEVEFCPLSGCLPNPFCTDPLDGHPTERGWFARGTEPTRLCPVHEEPPIRIVPADPADPHRIPLLPDDLSPDSPFADASPDTEPAGKPRFGRGTSRWFGWFSRWGRS
jgi:penicillin-binding protein 1A